jgi:hypothetical protein
MKTCLFILVLYLFGFGQPPFTGDWKVMKVETKDSTFYPQDTRDYYLYLSDTVIAYTDHCNDLWSYDIVFDNDTIILNPNYIASTLMYCMDPTERIRKYLDYSGIYKLQDTILVVNNSKGKLYLTRDYSCHFKNKLPGWHPHYPK